jgi:aryl-alcohol dehydrogenase-like predicted oxidoreductase
MEYRTFGTTDLQTSVVGFGTWPIGGAKYGASDDNAGIRAMQAALAAGVTCFDSAPSYGNGHAEELLGRAIAGHREEAVVVTKGGLVWDAESNVSGRNSRAEWLATHLDDSLRRLGTDYVDLFLIHWPDPNTPLEEVAAGLQSLVVAGKTRHVGVSNFTGEQVRTLAAAMGAAPLAANQISFSLFDGRWARSTFPACRDLGVGVMAYGPLAHGLLAGAFTRETVFEADDWRAAGVIFGQPLLTPENRDRNLDVVDRLKSVAAGLGATLPHLAIAWVLAHDEVSVALVGARNEQEIADAIGAATVRLADADKADIAGIMQDAAGLTDEMLT